jgi:hypothetical protein
MSTQCYIERKNEFFIISFNLIASFTHIINLLVTNQMRNKDYLLNECNLQIRMKFALNLCLTLISTSCNLINILNIRENS